MYVSLSLSLSLYIYIYIYIYACIIFPLSEVFHILKLLHGLDILHFPKNAVTEIKIITGLI